MSRTDAEVLVVGGGPAGSATASWLARSGRDVLLLDKTRFPRDKPCGEFFSPGAVAALRRLGALDAITLRVHSRPLGMRAVMQTGGHFLVSYSDDSSHQAVESGGLAMDRSLFDSALLDHARSTGVRVREGVQVIGPLTEGGRVIGIRARSGGGGVEELRARFVVAADGANSVLVRSLGLSLPALWPRRIGLAAHYADVEMDEGIGEMHVGHGVYCGIASVGGGLVSVGLAAPMGSKLSGETPGALLDRLLTHLPLAQRRLEGGRRASPVRGVGPLVRGTSRVGGPGDLLVGDAAGSVDPFTGEGVHRALVGAELASKAVERALARPDGLPVGYEAARRAAFSAKERVVLLVQLLLSRPPALALVLRRLHRRADAGRVISGVLGDYLPASSVVAPRLLWEFLRP